MLRLTIALILYGLGPFAFAGDTDALFQKGLGDYQAKKFETAREDFTQAFNAEPTNVRVLHNLALTHYQLNQKAQALAYWRKALAIDPNYRPARLGRELMETKMNMRPFERDPMDLWQVRTLERISLLNLGWILALGLAAVGGLWLAYLIRRRAARDHDEGLPALPLGALAVTVIFVLALVGLGLKLNQVFTPRATIVGEKVSARSLPTDDGVQLFEVPGGAEVLVRNQQGEWRQVENAEGSTGWIKGADLVQASAI